MSRQADEVNVKPQGSITRTLPKDMDLDAIETKIALFSQEVEAPVEEGQVLGVMTLSYEGEVYGKLDLVAVNSVERSELLYKKEQFISFFQDTWVQIVLAVVLLLAACFAFAVSAEGETTTAVMTAAERAASNESMGLGLIAAALVTGLAGIGGGMAVAAGAPAAIAAASEDPKSFGKSLIFVALGESIALYGVVISILILNKLV